MPLVAIQMQALKIGDHTTLVFTTVMNVLTRGLIDEDEDAEAAPADRAYWENKGTRTTVAIADQVLDIARECDPSLTLKYNKFYIALAKEGRYNFVGLQPQKSVLLLQIRLKQSDDVQAKIDAAGLDTLSYDARSGDYRFRLTIEDLGKHREILRELIQLAYESQNP
jgi:predicted transport protein